MELWKVGPMLKKLVFGSMHAFKRHIYLYPQPPVTPPYFLSTMKRPTLFLTTGPETMTVSEAGTSETMSQKKLLLP